MMRIAEALLLLAGTARERGVPLQLHTMAKIAVMMAIFAIVAALMIGAFILAVMYGVYSLLIANGMAAPYAAITVGGVGLALTFALLGGIYFCLQKMKPSKSNSPKEVVDAFFGGLFARP